MAAKYLYHLSLMHIIESTTIYSWNICLGNLCMQCMAPLNYNFNFTCVDMMVHHAVLYMENAITSSVNKSLHEMRCVFTQYKILLWKHIATMQSRRMIIDTSKDTLTLVSAYSSYE